MMIEDDTIQLIKTYFDHIQNFVTQLCEHYKVDDIWEGRKNGVIPRQASLDNMEYFFHGIGCTFEVNDTDVSFDLAPTGKFDGIDAWFLFKFLEGNMEKFPLLRNFDDVKKGLELLQKQGIIVPSDYPKDHLMYLKK